MSVDQPVPSPSPSYGRPETSTSQNWFGIVALVTGVLGISLVALIFGILGMRAAREHRATNRGMALAGVILGAIGMILSIAVAGVLFFTVLRVQDAAESADRDSAAGATPSPLLDPADATKFVLVPDSTSDTELLEAAAIFLATRVDADVSVDPNRDVIVVDFGSTPAGEGATETLTRTSSAQFRPVVHVSGPEISPDGGWPSPASAAPSWAGDSDYFATETLGALFDATDCTSLSPDFAPASDDGVVACASDGSAKYLLGAADLSADDISSVSIDGSVVTVRFNAPGTSALNDLTSRLSALSIPSNSLAFTADGLVRSAPAVASPIADGVIEVQFSNEAEAQEAGGSFTYGSPLMRLSIESAER